MTGDMVAIKFSGPNGAGKTLMMNVIKKRLEECGCIVSEPERGSHDVNVTIVDKDKLGKAARKAKNEKNDDVKLADYLEDTEFVESRR